MKIKIKPEEAYNLQSAIPKTETVGCFYCIGIEAHGIVAVKTVIDEYLTELPAYDTPYIFCPNCGRKLRENENG